MNPYRLFATLILSLVNLATCHQHFQQPLISTPLPILRNATLNDADDIASVIIAAFSPTPSWQYIYQFYASKPKEHHRCVRASVIYALTSPEFHLEVIEAPAHAELGVAAGAAWQQNVEAGGRGMFMSRVASKSNPKRKPRSCEVRM